VKDVGIDETCCVETLSIPLRSFVKAILKFDKTG